MACENKQVVIGKKNKHANKKSKTILKTVGRWDTKAVIVTQVRPTDSAINYQKKKNQNHENLPVFSSHPGAAYIELTTTY